MLWLASVVRAPSSAHSSFHEVRWEVRRCNQGRPRSHMNAASRSLVRPVSPAGVRPPADRAAEVQHAQRSRTAALPPYQCALGRWTHGGVVEPRSKTTRPDGICFSSNKACMAGCSLGGTPSCVAAAGCGLLRPGTHSLGGFQPSWRIPVVTTSHSRRLHDVTYVPAMSLAAGLLSSAFPSQILNFSTGCHFSFGRF